MAGDHDHTTLRAVVLQRICPHYRKQFYTALTHSCSVSFSVAFGSALPGDSLQSVAPDGIRHLPLENVWLGKSGRWVWQRGAIRLAWDKNIDVLILESDPQILSNLCLCLFGRLLGKKILLWGHGIGSRQTWPVRKLRSWIPRLLHGYIFYDKLRAREVISWGLPRRYVFIAANSLDTRTIRRLSHPWENDLRTNIICSGRLISEKRVGLLLHGFARATAGLPSDVCLTLIGDGPELESLMRLSQELGIHDRVQFTGKLTEEADLAPFFNSSWVAVSPGYLGLSAVHALAYGVPLLVAEGEPHSPEIVVFEPGVTGCSFTGNDPDDLAATLVRMWRNQAGLAAMSSRGVQKIEGEFSIQSMVESFEQAVRSVSTP